MANDNSILPSVTQLSKALLRHQNALLSATILSALLIAISTSIQTRMKEAAHRDMLKSLVTISETSQQALVSWVEEQKRAISIFADDDAVRSYTEDLLGTERNQDDLLKSPAQKELRDWFAPVLVTKNHPGFFIVTPDGVSIASARDTNVGSVNLLLQQEDFLEKITTNGTFMSRPLRSDVPLENEQGELMEGVPTMFVGAPIHDENSNVIAALLFRVDPQDDFNPILRRGRIGSSGETYTFDAAGNMISDSRFISDLIEDGLLDEGASDNLNLAIRDPSANLSDNDSQGENRERRPLTFMAFNATKKQPGQNVVGYRGYRGIPVVGAWLWNDNYNWGIATEISVDEAYAALDDNLAIIRSATIVVVVLILAILMLTSISRRRLVTNEKRYRSLFNNTSDAVVVADPVTRRLLDANDRACRELFYDRGEFLNLGISDLHPESVIDEVFSNWDRLNDESSITFETDVARKDGSEFCAEISVSLADLEKGTVCQAFIRDITHRKILEEKLTHSQKMETVGTLAGGVAHDFNNLLTPIIGNAQLIAANLDPESKLKTYTDRIIGTGNRAASLVSQLMTLGSKSEPNMSAINLSPVLEDAIKLIRTSIPHSISLTSDFSQDCAAITADASQIHQVIMNLCINASHAMEENGGELSVTLQPIDADDAISKMVDTLKEGSYAKIAVSDSGQGMDETVRRQIFDPFFSTKEKGKGTGLGLSTVHNIIASHGGHITVYSEPGVGTTFSIYLPTIGAVPADMPDTIADGKITGGQEHILVVDDDVENTTMMYDMLTQMGYSVTVTNDGESAVSVFSENQADINLLITDFAMPEMDGGVVIQKLREIQPNFPAIIMTGFGAALSSESVHRHGIKKLLNKPFTRRALDQAVRQALD